MCRKCDVNFKMTLDQIEIKMISKCYLGQTYKKHSLVLRAFLWRYVSRELE